MFKNVKKEEITVPAQMSYLTQVRDFIEHIGKRYKYPDKIINSFKLVIDEACTNIVRHGYRDIKNGEITIKAIIRRLSLTIIIIDQGRSYDIRQANTPDLAKYVDIGKKGGLGIMMMRKLMDDIQYSVTERGNELRLTKYRETTNESRLVQKWHSLNLKAKYSVVATIVFTLLIIFIFVPIYLRIGQDIRKEVFTVSASGCRALADNAIGDLLNDDELSLFEKSRSFKNNYSDIISEVFIVDDQKNIRAISDPLKLEDLETYEVPENAVLVDSMKNIAIFTYNLNDTTKIYDITTTIRHNIEGGGVRLGFVHLWVKEQTIMDLANTEKLQMIIILVIILTIGYLGAYFLIHRILSPFHSLADWVRQVVHGKVDQDEIDIDASDELGEIAKAFNDMTNKFREAQVTLMEQQKLQKELQVAQEIQQMLLPNDFPNVEGYEIASFYEAAKEVGGDLFDFVEIDDDTIGICVADVAGKGVPGSMIMTMIRTALRLESRSNKNPADVLAKVNRFVANDMKSGMFVTMFYIVLDSRNRIIHYASAGHNPMILYRGSTKQTYYLNPSGFPVGIQLPDLNLFDRKIETDSIRLREDDILVLYTDGITEAMNSKRELYREERFLNAVRNNAHLDVTGFIKSINKDLKNFTGGASQNDDITYVAIKEKMMPGEVIVNLQKELKRLIDEEGMKVKDALEKLRVSPHHYYRYKEIIERKGMQGLKEFLEGSDYVERKHLSIEAKAKIFDIIKEHPDYGANRIAAELRGDAYGNLKIDPNRIYNELVRMRLNTQKLRERYLKKGGKRRLKEPGTPLMTLDGKVILNFESSERAVGGADKAEEEASEAIKPPSKEPADERKTTIVKSNKEEETQQASQTSEEKSATSESDTEKPSKLAPEATEARKAEEAEPPSQEEETLSESEAQSPKGSDTEETEKESEKSEKEEGAEAAAEEVPKTAEEPVPEEDESPAEGIREESMTGEAAATEDAEEEVEDQGRPGVKTKEELIREVSPKLDRQKIDEFYTQVKDDIEALGQHQASLEKSTESTEILKKMNLILKIMLKHPILNDVPDFKCIFEMAQKSIQFMNEHADELSRTLVLKSTKVLIGCIEPNNGLTDYQKLYETINYIGKIDRQLNRSLSGTKAEDYSSNIEQIRKKLIEFDVIRNDDVLNEIENNDV